MRHVDADAMIERLKAWDTNDAIDTALYNFALNRILEAPTIETEPEIVRCKDCKHKEAENGFCKGRGWPMQLVSDDGFLRQRRKERRMSDLISRQDAIDEICMCWCGVHHKDCTHPFDISYDDCHFCDGCIDVETIKALPSAEPESKTGK